MRLRVSSQDFCYYKLGRKPTSWFVHLKYTSLFLACANQFPQTSQFSLWSATIWHAHPPYDRSISLPTDHLRRTNSNSCTKKIRLASVTNSQAVANNSRVARCSPSTRGFSCNNLHNFHGFNHSHSQSSQPKDFSLTVPLSSS